MSVQKYKKRLKWAKVLDGMFASQTTKQGLIKARRRANKRGK